MRRAREMQLVGAGLSMIAIFGCSDSSAPPAELPKLARGTFEATLTGGVSATLAGRAEHIVYEGDGTLFVYLTDTLEGGAFGGGGMVLERRGGVPTSTAPYVVENWIEASSGDPQRFALGSFITHAGSPVGVEFSSLTGTVTIDSVGAGAIVGHFTASGPASLAGSGAPARTVTVTGRFFSHDNPPPGPKPTR